MSIPDIPIPLDMSYLYEISDNDREFVKDMIDTIVKNTPDGIKEIRVAADKNNWKEVGRLVHKFKPSLLLLNIDSVSKHIRVLETNAKEEINLDDAITQLKELEEYSAIIIHELATEIKEGTY